MAVRSGGQAPYAPPQTVIGLIHAFRNRPLQTPFTADVLMRAGVKDSLVPRVMASLKALDLIDENGMPTPALDGLRRAPQAEYRMRLEEIVRGAYDEVFQYFDPATDDEEKARDIFRHYEPIGQLSRIVRLFMGLCEEAGLIPEGKRKPAMGQAARGNAPRNKPAPARPLHRREAASEVEVANLGSRRDLPPALSGLLAMLPASGTGWSKDERDRFLQTFGTVLDFAIPIQEAPLPSRDSLDDDE